MTDQDIGKMLPLLKRAEVTVHVKLNGMVLFRDKRTGRGLNGIDLKRRLSNG